MSGGQFRRPVPVNLMLMLMIGTLVPSSAEAYAESPSSASPALKWEKLGASTGRPLVFLPAVGLPGRCWSKVYDQFAATNPIYVITYAGSGGVPAMHPPYLQKIVDGLHDLITQEKLKDPVLIGHFLGLQLSLRLAAEHPGVVGGIFGLPMASARPPIDQRKQAGERVAAAYLETDSEMWLPAMAQQIRGVVRDPATVEQLMEMIKQTDRESYARMMGELEADLVEEYLPKVQCPVYLIATVPPQQRRETIEDGQERLAAISQARVDILRMLYPGLPKCNITALRNVEFYAMIDSANRLVFPLQRFLKRLDDPKSRWESTAPTATRDESPTAQPVSP